MPVKDAIQQLFFRFLSQYQYDEADLDDQQLARHISRLQVLSEIGHSGIGVFDIFRKQIAFFSSNYGKLLGYLPAEFEALNYKFFEEKIHPDDQERCALCGISALKMFNTFSPEEKMSHKVIYEYRMRNSQGKYVRLIEQYQILELDRTGQIWLLLSIVDISPNQEEGVPVKCQLLNFKTGSFVPFEIESDMDLALTQREMEVLRLVKQGYLSKEISDKLSISVHTVNTHRQRFLEKLGANNSMEAVAFASRMGLLV